MYNNLRAKQHSSHLPTLDDATDMLRFMEHKEAGASVSSAATKSDMLGRVSPQCSSMLVVFFFSNNEFSILGSLSRR